MAFFDLSILYQDPEAVPTPKHAEAAKTGRLRAAVKAMELGYTGVAYDRHISGVMSDRDRCTIAPFPLSSLLKVSPTLSASVRFHRELVGVPLSSPFRQYRRLTVSVESAAQAAALNSGNPVLKTYDLVAVRPLSQASFELACKTSEVHLITIDFSQKLPFRLKGQLSNVQLAIKRRVYFEICYSHLIDNAQLRRQMLSGAKLLVDYTRGKNIILSSAATSADQIRGPYDVANISSLFGLSSERAKASTSRNCRSLLISAFTKKQFFMGAIKVEKITPKDQQKLDEERLNDWNSWDPISSGEGDLPPVDDMDMLSSYSKVLGKFSSSNRTPGSDDLALENKLLNEENTDRFWSNKSLFSASETPYFFSAVKEARSKEKISEPISEVSSFASWFPYNKDNVLSVKGDTSNIMVTEEVDMVISEETGVTSIPLEVASLKDQKPDSELDTRLLNSEATTPTNYEPCEPVIFCDSMETSISCKPSDGCIEEQADTAPEHLSIDNSLEIDRASFFEDRAMSCDENSVFLHNGSAAGEAILLVELPQQRIDTSIRCNVPMDVCAIEDVLQGGPDDCHRSASRKLVEDLKESEIKGKGSAVLDRSLHERDMTLAKQQAEDITSVNEFKLHKHKSGKAKVVQQLKGQSYQLPFKGLLKPLLFKKKGKQTKASRKHHASSSEKMKAFNCKKHYY